MDVPGEYVLVDHALSCVARGLVGKLVVEGDERMEVFKVQPASTAELGASDTKPTEIL